MNTNRSQAGVGMIEVLFSMVILTFGFLSILTMQLDMLSNVSATSQHYQATSLAHDMGERIRSDAVGFDQYHEMSTEHFNKDCLAGVDHGQGPQPAPPGTGTGTATATNTGTGTDTSTDTDDESVCSMAEEQFFNWQQSISDDSLGLVNAVGKVTAEGGIATIEIFWTEHQAGEQPRQASYSLQVSLE